MAERLPMGGIKLTGCLRQGDAAHAAAHRGDVDDAERCRSEAAGFLGMTPELGDRYGHHHPDYQQEAGEAVTRRRQPARKGTVAGNRTA